MSSWLNCRGWYVSLPCLVLWHYLEILKHTLERCLGERCGRSKHTRSSTARADGKKKIILVLYHLVEWHLVQNTLTAVVRLCRCHFWYSRGHCKIHERLILLNVRIWMKNVKIPLSVSQFMNKQRAHRCLSPLSWENRWVHKLKKVVLSIAIFLALMPSLACLTDVWLMWCCHSAQCPFQTCPCTLFTCSTRILFISEYCFLLDQGWKLSSA